MNDEHAGKVYINSEGDLITARKTVRTVATGLGFSVTDVTRIVTAASELVRNIFVYAGSGVMCWQMLDTGSSVGIELIFEDNGPGIADVEQAMQAGYSSGNGMGLGLPGAKRLMDEMELQTQVGTGTTVKVRKWKRT